MKILVCHNFYRRHGGADAVMLYTKEFLEERGHEVVPFAMEHPENLPSPYSRYFVRQVDYAAIRPWHLIRTAREAGRILFSVEAYRKLTALISEVKPDLAHCHNIYHELSPSILTVLKRAGIPIVLTLHDYKLLCPNRRMYVGGMICERCLHGKFLNAVRYNCVYGSRLGSLLCAIEGYAHRGRYRALVDAFISPSRFLLEKMTEAGLPADRIAHIPNAVPAARSEPEYHCGDYALYLGLLTLEKGVHVLIEALKKTPGVPLKIAGTGPFDDELRQMALGLKNVEFVGFASGERLDELIRNCRFVVVPSISYENCPMSILDAFSWGKPVVGSNLGGIPELVAPGVTGLLATPGDPDDLFAKVEEMWTSPERAIEMGRNARARTNTDLSADTYIEKVLAVYQSILRR